MNLDIAIKVDHVSKSFRIPREQRNTIREHVIRFRKRMVYESFQALNDVSFEIRKGEFFSIIGRNGSGKSTLLKILAGIYSTDSGSVVVNGELSPFLELGVGFNPELSGKDNVYLNGMILGLSKLEIDRIYQKIVDFSELDRFIHLKVKNYSSGMHVRLAFSVAVHANKEILLMDEVLAVGDANFQVKCFNVFEQFIREGKTIIFVSHDPGPVQKYSDRVMYLESGKPAFIGRADEALSRYMYTDVIDKGTGDQKAEPSREESVQGKTTVVIPGSTGETPETPEAEQLQRKAEKVIEITQVQVLNEHRQPTRELNHGTCFYLHLHYSILQSLTEPVFGIIIHDQKKRVLFTTNTYIEKVKIGKIDPGNIIITYRIDNYFSTGKYAISSVVSDRTQRIFYEWKDDIFNFRVTNMKRLENSGGVDLPHEITIEKNPV
ncbi:MAG TPA: ABC transporter ATP-binding protein [Bacteroidales bacterium]|nr:ABC transporter ATP-binding protein [Bacteroidales bacterium]HPS50470.1 ABC transporter ATP-binding protein [Bacteroidales bacterium]